MTNKYFNNINKDYLAIILIVLVSIVIYFTSLGNPFVFDDVHMIVENPFIKIPERFLSFFTTGEVSLNQQVKGMYRPLLMVTFSFNYYFGRLNPIGYHIINIMFHFLNGILIFFLIKVLSEKSIYKNQQNYYWPLLFAAMLFVVHPINSETVNYISARSSLMVTFFILFAVFLYVKKDNYSSGKRIFYYLGSLFSFIGALLSKESAIMLPFIIILYDIHFNNFNKFKDFLKLIIKNYIPFFIIVLLYLGLRIKLFGGLINENYIFTRPIFTNILIQIKVIVYYLKLFIWPSDLCLDRFISSSKSLFQLDVFLSAFLLLFLIIFSIKAFKKERLISFSIFWFFINLVPISTIIPFNIVMSEHRFYAPGIGLFFLITAVLRKLFFNEYLNHRKLFLITVIVIIILAICSIITIRRNIVWQDALTLWQDTVRVSPKSFRAHNDLGIELLKRNELDKAIQEFKKAIELRGPNEAKLYCNLAYAYTKKGWYDEAVRISKDALVISPNSAEAYHNLGLIYQKNKEFDKAISYYKRALKIDPYSVESYNNLGLIFQQMGLIHESIQEFKYALRINPDLGIIHFNLGKSYLLLKPPDKKSANLHFEIAKKLGFYLD